MMVGMVLMKVEFGPMLKHERNAVKGDLFTTEGRPYADESNPSVISRGTVMDLLIPIISLIICCVIGMLYTGGFFSGVDFVTAFSESNASFSELFRMLHERAILPSYTPYLQLHGTI